ncbi:MAG: DUF3160 domain-containing protein [Planctomycetes bacterium]|nr:DUF3160 domain-containing protein [Planctomycetota bacterium]
MKRYSLLALALMGILGAAYHGVAPTSNPVQANPPAAAAGGQLQGGFANAFQGELKVLGQISTEEFARRYPSSAKYLDAFPWDPTTAQYYDHLQLDPNDPKSQIRARGHHAQALRQQLQQQAIQKGEDPKLVPERPMVSAKGHFDFRLNADEQAKFKKNGFVVSERMGAANFIEMYYRIYARDMPVFVSSDAILHAWHHSYDAMLEETETFYLHPNLNQILCAMHNKLPEAQKEYGQGTLQSSVKDADYFLTVAIRLLHGDTVHWPTHLDQDARVNKTLKACADLKMEKFNLFGRDREVDFSQFKVRGHYEKSQTLAQYFRAMMWLGRTDLRVAGYGGNTSAREMGASLVLHDLLQRSKKFQDWQNFDNTIQTFVGKTDSMTFAQLGDVLKEAKFQTPAQVKNVDDLVNLQKAVLASNAGVQEIRGDIFQSGEPLPRSFTFLGQKFVVDSWALNKVVYDDILWDNRPVRRKIPSGLDVSFAVFGNNQVVPQIVDRINNRDGNPLRDGMPYQHNLAAVRNVIDRLPETYWDENLYTQWLGSLRELSKPTTDVKNPQVMQTKAWAMKSLNTTMASWTQLRHDTILYAKQSYASVSCFYPAGYVEPLPAFWGRMEKMAGMTGKMLGTIPYPESMKYQKDRQAEFCKHFATTMGTLKAIAEKELAQKELNAEETKFLGQLVEVSFGCGGPPMYYGWYPRLYYGDRDDLTRWDALVADVHTDPMSGVLHQGVGNVDLMVIAVDNGKDRMLYLGPTMSHYEFEVAGANRKSDSEWRADLKAGKTPPRPEWTRDYLAPGLNPRAKDYVDSNKKGK